MKVIKPKLLKLMSMYHFYIKGSVVIFQERSDIHKFLSFSAMNFDKILKFISRSSHLRCSVKKGVFKNFAKFTGKQLCQSLFFNKAAGLGLHTISLCYCY